MTHKVMGGEDKSLDVLAPERFDHR
jgi:hypothetical protein